MPNIIRMGFIGGGHALQEIHLPLFSQMEEVLPLVLCDIREDALKNALRKFGIRETTTHWQDVVQMREIDAVIITLPNDLHALVAERALRAGKHVLCEKPAAIDEAGAQAVARAVRETGNIYMMALPHRFDVEAHVLRGLIARGRIGTPFHVRAGLLRCGAHPSGWFVERARSGGGALVQFGTHVIDLALWLMDFPPVESVNATTRQSGGPMRNGLPPANSLQNVEDAATVMMRLQHGRSITIETDWDHRYGEDRQYLEIQGDRGAATLWPLRVFGEIDGVRATIAPEYAPSTPYRGLARHFIDLVLRHERGERGLQPIASAEDGVRLATVIHKIYESAEAGREIQIENSPNEDSRGVLK